MKELKTLPKLEGKALQELISNKETFVLYVRSQKDYQKIREIFDVDVVFPELAKTFGHKLRFYWCDIDEVEGLGDIKVFFAPVVVLFKEGRLVHKLEGIRSWAEYNRALGELLC